MQQSRPRTPRALGASLALLAATVCVLVVVELAVPVVHGSTPLWVVPQLPLAALIFLATGLIAWSRRPSNHTGALMVCGALVLLVTDLGTLEVPWLTSVSVVLGTLMLAVLVHLLLAFPSGRLRTTAARSTVLAVYAVSLVLQVPLYLFDPDASPGGMLAVAQVPAARTAGLWTQRSCGIAVMLVAAAILLDRFRRAHRRERRVIGPLYVYGIAAVLAVPLIPAVIRPVTGMSNELATMLQAAVISLVPIAIGCAMLLGGFARTGEVQELGAWLGADAGRPTLRDALAGTLGDPSLRLAFKTGDRYVDGFGRTVRVPDPGSGRGVVEVTLAQRPVAVIDYDAGLIGSPELVADAGRVVALALDRERLTAELRASQHDLRESRVRIVQAGDRERRRIAQDLHDGLQAELVLLGVQAQSVADIQDATAEVGCAATQLRRRIDQVADELRQLVHTVMPPPLTQGGLVPAVEDLVDRMPLPTGLRATDLGADGGRGLPTEVQSTAYFVVAEGLTNAVKHASASRIDVSMTRSGQRLVVRVADDGVGGAHLGCASGGAGLSGLSDRVQALDGRLTVDSLAGGGTRLVAELPCEW